MNVYDIFLDRRDSFVLYQLDGEWVPITHKTKYIPCKAGIWDNETKTFGPGPGTNPFIDKLSVPTWRVKSKDLQDCIEHNLGSLLECVLDLGGDEIKRYNIMIPQRLIEDDYIELGFFSKDGRGEVINEKADRFINTRLKLKAFW